MPEPSRALDDGQCATLVPLAAIAAMAASSSQTAWAYQTSGPSQSMVSQNSTGRMRCFSFTLSW